MKTWTIAGRQYDDNLQGALDFQMDIMNPFDTDPEWVLLRAAYGSGIAYGGFAVVASRS